MKAPGRKTGGLISCLSKIYPIYAERDDVTVSLGRPASGRIVPFAAPFLDCPPTPAGNFLGNKRDASFGAILSGDIDTSMAHLTPRREPDKRLLSLKRLDTLKK